MQSLRPDVTVVVGRFQVPYLHAGHEMLLKNAIKRTNGLCIILIGKHDNNFTTKDPIPHRLREKMIEDWIFKHKSDPDFNKDIYVGYIKDVPFSDTLWSKSLDSKIGEIIDCSLVRDTCKVVLLGGRDSFLQYYTGKYLGYQLPEVSNVSGTAIREQPLVPSTEEQSKWYRSGMIAAQIDKPYGNIYPTVDAIVYRKIGKKHEILLGKKHGESEWRLPGGHVNISDKSLEEAVTREVHEECGLIELGTPEYFMSTPLNDRRYRGTKDAVYTTVFKVPYVFGSVKAGDDLQVVQWFETYEVGMLDIIEDHKEIIKKVYEE